MSEFDDLVGKTIEALRDVRRPTFEAVLALMEEAFEKMEIPVRKVESGPDVWMWEDTAMADSGLPKYYVLSKSLQEGIEGYPLFTVRQAYSLKLDTWLSMSTLVVGPDDTQISHSLALAVSHHLGAFAGVRYTAASVTAYGGSPQAGVLAVRELLHMKPPEMDVDEEFAELIQSTHPKDVN